MKKKIERKKKRGGRAKVFSFFLSFPTEKNENENNK